MNYRSPISEKVKNDVRKRSKNRCEDCGIEEGFEQGKAKLTFHHLRYETV